MALSPFLVLLMAAPIDWSAPPAHLPRSVSETYPAGVRAGVLELRAAADALARGDAAPLIALLHASATWTAAPSRTFARTTQLDRRAAQSYLTMMANGIRNGGDRLSILSVTPRGNELLVSATWGPNQQQCSTLVRLMDGRIARVIEHAG